MILSGNPAIASRMRIVDFSSAWTDTPAGVLIPYPVPKNNLAAIIKPFEWKVRKILPSLFFAIIVQMNLIF